MFPTPLAFSRWAYALSRATAGRMGATTYLVPLLAVLMGWTILGEVPRRSPWSAAVVVPDEKKR